MCGRYVLAKDYEELKARFGLEQGQFAMKPRYNIAPQTENPVITKGDASTPLSMTDSKARQLQLMQWGLIPHWAKDPKIAYKMINARAETVHEKPSFREPFKKHRCLIPANGFYEWVVEPGTGNTKKPIFIHLKKQELYAFAGLCSFWGEGDRLKKTYTIITTEANDLLKKYHDRMPVILTPDEEEKWLDPNSEPKELLRLLDSFPAERMDAYEVSTIVNKPINDSPECIKPVRAA